MLKDPCSVLVVEDESDFRTYLIVTLKRMGADGIAAESVVDAFKYLTEGKAPDLVISDINLPGASGLDLIEALRESGYTMPVILISAVRSWADTELQKRGAAGFLEKPFKSSQLEEVINKALEINSMA